MSKSSTKMPTDKQIWAEVDEWLASYPETLKKLKRVPDRQALFEKKKAWYHDAPRRKEYEEQSKAAALKKIADADAAYLALRKAQGKQIITVEKFVADFPKNAIKEGLNKATQQELHESYELLGYITSARTIQRKVNRVRALSRKLLFEYLAQTYGLYRRILRSEIVELTFNDLAARLWNEHKIKTHADIPRSSILLKMVFEGASEKTIHLYTRSFQLADGYDVDESGFPEFIKQIGGLEKIRKAYATVIAADAGKLSLPYEKDAEYSASLNELYSKDPTLVFQLTGPEGAMFRNDLLDRFCLLVAHIDPLNQLEIYGQMPASKVIEKEVVSKLTSIYKKAETPSWVSHKSRSTKFISNRVAEKMIEKESKRLATEEKAKKKSDAAAKKEASVQRRFAKQRDAERADKK